VHPGPKREGAMKRDVLVISGGMLAVGVVVWAFRRSHPYAYRPEMQAAPGTQAPLRTKPLHADGTLAAGRQVKAPPDLVRIAEWN
jgi:hypothetical protein